jgi:hypothetical protein
VRAEHEVDELLIVDPQAHSVAWLTLQSGEYGPVDRSKLIGVRASELADRIEWPPTSDS